MTRSPSIADLPEPPAGKTGWPWTEDTLIEENSSGESQMLPRFSIVTPSFNQGRFIEETIRSVLLQGYPNVEYIIIDGGSNDESVDIIRKYEPWLAYWVSEPDRGQAHAINKGFERATGEFIAWINSDDVYCPGAFKSAADAFAEESPLALAFGESLVIDQDGRIVGKNPGKQFTVEEMLLENQVPQPSAFVRHEAAKSVGYLNERYHFVLDLEWWIRLALTFPVRHIGYSLSKFRLHAESKSMKLQTLRWREVADMLHALYRSEDCPSWSNERKRAALGNANWQRSLALLASGDEAAASEAAAQAAQWAPRWTHEIRNREKIADYAVLWDDPAEFIHDFVGITPFLSLRRLVVEHQCMGLIYLRESADTEKGTSHRRSQSAKALLYDPWLLTHRNHSYRLLASLLGRNAAEFLRTRFIARMRPRQ